MKNPNRNLKIIPAFAARHLPSLPLKGRWLERAGFAIGMRVDVIVRDRCLLILPSENALPPDPASGNKQ